MRPAIPQGTRDFAADILRRRHYIMNTIKSVFELYGFEPLETPAMENLETLMGKYGDEGDQLIFKILNNGLNHPSKKEVVEKGFESILNGRNEKSITERALRYDLTIPFARYVAMNTGKLTVPFKRYQIQPVWRADRPQKGRYREFYQCDADIAGTRSLISDVELAEVYLEVFKRLNLGVTVKINSRKILSALAEVIGSPELMTAITSILDKLDKIGLEKVTEELKKLELSDKAINTIVTYIELDGSNEEKLDQLSNLLSSSKNGLQGIEELKFVLQYVNDAGNQTQQQKISIDFTLARGLNYYTGIIYEVKAENVSMGSIGGGGRYDDLTGLFGVPNVPGVGISFGLDRIYDVMEELKLFPESILQSTQVLFFNLGEKESRYAFLLMQQLRTMQISCEMYYESSKFDKQFKYAVKKNIHYAVIIGSDELENGTCIIKDLFKESQETISSKDLAGYLEQQVKNQLE